MKPRAAMNCKTALEGLHADSLAPGPVQNQQFGKHPAYT